MYLKVLENNATDSQMRHYQSDAQWGGGWRGAIVIKYNEIYLFAMICQYNNFGIIQNFAYNFFILIFKALH